MAALNTQTNAAWHYHRVTSHSWESLQASPHTLDWGNYPQPFKIYRDLPTVPLPREWPRSTIPALTAIFDDGTNFDPTARLDLFTLARLLYLSGGVVRWRNLGGMRIPFRTAACTGNLHHIDLYVVCATLPGLEAGVYHFGPQDFALRLLRRGDFRANVCTAAAAPPELRDAPVWLVCTSTFWRNAWKYRGRTYRHAFWDSGTILANLFAAAASVRIRHRLLVGFVDREINALLGVDGRKEVSLAVVGLGAKAKPPGESLPVPALQVAVEPYSRREVEYPEIVAMHQASTLDSTAEVESWRLRAKEWSLQSSVVGEPLPALREFPKDPIEEVIARRGSTRKFQREPIPLPTFSVIVRAARTKIPADFQAVGPLTDAYAIVHSVTGLDPGAYFCHPTGSGLALLRRGEFRHQAGALALGQALAADAAANLYHLADLHKVLPTLGNRGYRAAQLEGGIAGGKIYLAAFSLGIGATGLTFFDDDVTSFFSPHGAGKSVMFLTAVGKPARRK
ncbi:MAG: SagB/ThcOx family dehydrogenase [Candidatus Binatia bacterium]|nr:SagB/ThcOx family dehydrogenase [Candidatus Binatia bacterium]